MEHQSTDRQIGTPGARRLPPRVAAAMVALALLASGLLVTTAIRHRGAAARLERRSRPPRLTTLTDPRLAAGMLLVAERHLRDPNFRETVVLLVHHDADGALGLIVNRPSKMLLADVLPDFESASGRDDRVFVGGPVALRQILFLVRSQGDLDGARPVLEDILFSASRPLLEELLDRGEEEERLRLYAGHSGWGGGQLEAEVARGDWRILPGSSEVVFHREPESLWLELVRQGSLQLAGRQVSPAHSRT